jgi:hypothetical protein
MKAATALYDLYNQAKNEDNSQDYIDELCEQLKLFGVETNKLTREYILNKLTQIVKSIEHTMET